LEFYGSITLETLVMIDAGQNISDFNENNNTISVGYGWICLSCQGIAEQDARHQIAGIVPHPCRMGEKKGCAARTPNPNREPLGDGAKPSP
jgi:hypothetical protein